MTENNYKRIDLDSSSFEELNIHDTDIPRVVYVSEVGKDVYGMNIYHMLISYNADETWAEFWDEKPASNCGDITPEEDMYTLVKEIRTDFKFDLAQDNTCFSMQDCRDLIVALAYENLDEAEEYPEPCRIVIHFGDSLYDVEKMLAKRNIVSTLVSKNDLEKEESAQDF